ncbi:uracil permease [Treponema socranskii subsp. socranskii VPI DR56BR1116 = ATCC 35536]|uniref:Uracil permease n=1 Tax=Treponema socranskii subsp. socranskii VPI DR56BR1116 = ATCC 35536 TaxID=1125725 RepID=U1GU74_TRESO|nr:solute carrier family 23 protein [Treponema socranskii]ERF60134.1 uracil permease [Treponema socranskii subsp. socranskii VPI DR56BR1116 = ATCC 35536]
MNSSKILGPHDKPPLAQWIPLSFQHVFAMFGATILVPLLTGLNPSTALFTAGTGTLIYIFITGAKVPAFLGSSFAFIPALIGIGEQYGVAYAMGGAICAGVFYCVVALIIKFTGKGWIDKALPPVVIGSVIVVIGMNLAPTAIKEAMYIGSSGAMQDYSLVYLSIAVVTLGIAIVSTIFLKGFFNTISILIGLVGGYLFALVMGAVFPAYSVIDFSVVREAKWFALPFLQTDAAGKYFWLAPKFNFVASLTFVIVSLATICEHLGDTLTTSRVVGKDFLKDPGLHRTLVGDGLATAWAAVWGGPPNTTYGENIGVMAITKVYSVWVIGGAAVIAFVLSFCQKFGAVIQTIPGPVLGGVSMLLYGLIASSGLRTLVEEGVDYKDKRNLTISSVVMVIGIGGGILQFTVGSDFVFSLGGVALSTVVGIVLNLIIPKTVE